MSEFSDGWTPEQAHFNYDATGRVKVDIRQHVYTCLAEGYPYVDLDLKAITALQYAGLDDKGRIVDIGSSFPYFLDTWQHSGHQGELIAVEPNTAQLMGAPFWTQRSPNDQSSTPEEEKQLADFEKNYILNSGSADFDLGRIKILKSPAESILLDSGSALVVTSMFMFYHVARAQQARVMAEFKRLLHPDSGVFVLATRGQQNKRGMRQTEEEIQDYIHRRTNRPVSAPEPINSGYTSEDGRVMLPELFTYVYEYRHEASLVFNTYPRMQILRNAHWTLYDLFRDAETNEPFSPKIFGEALDAVLRYHTLKAALRKESITDQLDESLFIAADHPLILSEDPNEFKLLSNCRGYALQ